MSTPSGATKAQHIVAGLTLEERAHFDQIDPAARGMLLDGDLNPAWWRSTSSRRSFTRTPLHPENPDVADGDPGFAHSARRSTSSKLLGWRSAVAQHINAEG
jgi:hypothetical protein